MVSEYIHILWSVGVLIIFGWIMLCLTEDPRRIKEYLELLGRTPRAILIALVFFMSLWLGYNSFKYIDMIHQERMEIIYEERKSIQEEFEEERNQEVHLIREENGNAYIC